MRWYRSGQWNRLEQPVGKQYSYGKGGKPVFEATIRSAKTVQENGKEVSPKIVVEWMVSSRGEVSITQACAHGSGFPVPPTTGQPAYIAEHLPPCKNSAGSFAILRICNSSKKGQGGPVLS